jgi:hypothetical protein
MTERQHPISAKNAEKYCTKRELLGNIYCFLLDGILSEGEESEKDPLIQGRHSL